MNPVLRFIVMPLALILAMAGGIYVAAGGDLSNHFHGAISDHTPQSSIHPLVIDSGFTLRQAIDTKDLAHVKRRLRESPACLWLRLEYPRNGTWDTEGTLLLTLSTQEHAWTTQVKSEQITTYFQPFCFQNSRTEQILDRETVLELSVVEPDLRQVAMIALGPANGQNNAEINGEKSEYTATYNLTANTGPNAKDQFVVTTVCLFTLALLMSVLFALTSTSNRQKAHPFKNPTSEGEHA